ncbi:leucine-rich repeat-containing protein 71-like isoform X3 [Biomphalaria glabrata]|uniref:Leucine-rich repeat-containing protein 71-like isoform X3 n=2 Tax=Biomphalaria glabrata TaxID=6526 RepID=A0A9W2ZUR9_BIOGL|nr:leucine-rich repeat-containing protein 71-like isoform X3 [Biomphalaria glabrata]
MMENLWSKTNILHKVKMGKKVEKSFSKDRHLSSAAHHDDENSNKTPEPHKCTGSFEKDFTELCKQNAMSAIPNVLLRQKSLTGQSGSVDLKSSKREDKKQPVAQVHDASEADTEINEDGEPIELPPKTYTTKPIFEYLKPSVQVEMDNPDKFDTVTEVYVRGWKIDATMMEIFRQCWLTLDRLHTINLWNTGLTESTLHTLATFLPQCLNLVNVVLDGNTVKEENWSELLGLESLIQHLSLRHCKITDKGAEKIGKALGHAKWCNTKLITLNLSGNLIGDVGAQALAEGLRMNRTLLSLTLMSNNIGDKGSEKLAETLSRFPLTHEEIVERRKLLSDRSSPERKSPTPSRRGESKDRPGSVRSTSTIEKTKGTKPSAKKKDIKEKDAKEGTKTVKKDKEGDGRGSKSKGSVVLKAALKVITSATIADATKSVTAKKDKKPGKGRPVPTDSEDADLMNSDGSDQLSALLENGEFMDGQYWIAGNRVLVNLNLARNNIGEEGLAAILKAIQYQTTLALANENKPGANGLLRLQLHKNNFSFDCEAYRKLTDLMASKDPMAKYSISPDISK